MGRRARGESDACADLRRFDWHAAKVLGRLAAANLRKFGSQPTVRCPIGALVGMVAAGVAAISLVLV